MKLGYEPSHHHPSLPPLSLPPLSLSPLLFFFSFPLFNADKVFSRFEKWRDIKRGERSSGP